MRNLPIWQPGLSLRVNLFLFLRSGRNLLEGRLLPDQPNHPEGPKILHPQHACPASHSHYLPGWSLSHLWNDCFDCQVIQNSVTMHTLLGYQSRVSTIRSQVRYLSATIKGLVCKTCLTINDKGARSNGDRTIHPKYSGGESRGKIKNHEHLINLILDQKIHDKIHRSWGLHIYDQVALYIFSRNQSNSESAIEQTDKNRQII